MGAQGATAATIAVVETTLFAAVTVRLGVRAAVAFWAGAELRTAVSAAVITAITAATASATATMLLATAISAAVAAFVTTAFAALTLILALVRSGRSLLGGVTAEEAL